MSSRTVPTINGTPTFRKLSITMYDYTGDQRTESYMIDSDASDAEIEAIVDALQTITNGTIWRVEVGDVYNSVGDSSNADEVVWENIKTNVVLLAKTATNVSQDWYVPAPNNDLFIEGTEEIDPTNTDLAAYMTAILAVRTGYSFVSGRFTHRSKIGSKINF